MRSTIIGAVLACTVGTASAQSVRFVNASASGSGNGQSWATAYRSLQSALDDARANPAIHQIWVAAGTYTPKRSSANRDESLMMVNAVEILGGFNGAETLASQRDPASHITILSGDLSANDTANFGKRTDNIAGGVAPDLGGFGGGLLVQGGDVQITGCRFLSNRGMNGGALGIFGSLTDRTAIDCIVAITDCEFNGNFSPSQSGGAIWSATADPLEPQNGIIGEIRALRCTFTNNHAEYHGAWIDQNATTLLIDDCDFTGNFSNDYAGAMGISQTVGIASPALIRRSTFTNNGIPAGRGSGIFAQARPSVLDSCTFTANKGTSIVHSQPVVGFSGGAKELELRNCVLADNTGTAIFGFHNPSLTVTNCTILRNPSTISGGLAGGIETSAAVVTVSNTILWGNHRGAIHDQDAQIRSFSASAQISHSILEGLVPGNGTANLGLDPMLTGGVGPGVLDGSPAIDTGDNSLLPADVLDLDDDQDLAEPLPLDLVGTPRRLDDPASDDCRFSSGDCGSAPLTDIGAVEFIPTTCPADFDGSGFVDIEDYTQFVLAFEAGSDSADFDHSGFVDTDDFDAFVEAFEVGC